ncbi:MULTISPECIES: type IV pilus biogenesis/stability protein PilW [unclassified Ectothiorhodospira]|uniref:type IV pilus biogenesis/stability protein PilW n=1 Tax=unclassified Ectothiorhodospira TaxID=2684909 RepID=UPI001EE816FF|nr:MULTISPECIES: type IV pilus biogenesis/stability protein PilW [unclassified Ectothiorhodospira]MCG5515392.1 type IV pilus biogenesis/stability protein PilW [Ectothiorhodospira sp. 9100]MCG5518255.1 type IV pilus biogenesis/stability protein PilW [Ectothiorhodospira sp. 9905]
MSVSRLIPATILLLALVLTGCAAAPEVQDQQHRAARVNVELGLHYMRQNQLQQAKSNLERALGQDPGSAQVHAAYALLQQRIREPEKADRHFRRALDLDPDNAVVRNNYGTFLCRQDRLEEAETAFTKAAEDPLYSTPEVAWTNAGICALKYPDEELAEQYFRRALEVNPNHADALYEMMRLADENDRYLQARAYVQRLMEVANPTPEILWVCYRAELALGNRDASGDCALRLKNDFPDAQETQRVLEREARGGR